MTSGAARHGRRSNRRQLLRGSLTAAGVSLLPTISPPAARARVASLEIDHEARVAAIQELLRLREVPAWLFYDFRMNNRVAYRALGLDEAMDPSRRWHYLVPPNGEPQKLVSALEPTILDSLPGTRVIYRTWQEREENLRAMLSGLPQVAMEYSPDCAVPYVSNVDGGTLELIRSFGLEVVTSADLAQDIVSRWGPEQLESHLEASRRLMRIGEEAFALVAGSVQAGTMVTDYDVQQFMANRYVEEQLVTDFPPIVATNANAGDPHYEPIRERATAITEGDVLLIDFWAKRDLPGAVYADYTWMAYVGDEAPKEPARIFALVAEARDTAIAFVRDAVAAGRTIHGWEVDDAARGVIEQAGFGEQFVHRTGHNIHEDVHGEGANMDNYESHETREVLSRTCFSIEPGIYLPDFGVRSEVNVFIDGADILVTGDQQRAMTALLG